MYTAKQARNIANEKENHIYYGLYRQYARDLMRAIEYAVEREVEGQYGTAITSNSKSTARDRAVLEQLGTEMTECGYKYNVSTGDGNMKGRYVLTITW